MKKPSSLIGFQVLALLVLLTTTWVLTESLYTQRGLAATPGVKKTTESFPAFQHSDAQTLYLAPSKMSYAAPLFTGALSLFTLGAMVSQITKRKSLSERSR